MVSHRLLESLPPPSVAIIGAGRLGTALARALRPQLNVRGPYRRGELPEVGAADVILICVPDDQIAVTAKAVAGLASCVGHVSGATSVAALAAAGPNTFGMHPLQTFLGNDDPSRFIGIGCAIAGSNSTSLAMAHFLAQTLQMLPFPIEDEARAAYHAAACLSSNYLMTLLDSAERVAGAAGLSPAQARKLLGPLVETAVQNWRTQGPKRALTGPVARGDDGVVRAHREAVAVLDPDLRDLFELLTGMTEQLASKENH